MLKKIKERIKELTEKVYQASLYRDDMTVELLREEIEFLKCLVVLMEGE